MSKQVDQGTRHETAIRKRAEAIGRKARRTAKAGQKHEADVIIDGEEILPAVFWKQYINKEGSKKRRAVRMVVLREEDFWTLAALDWYYGWAIQAKATQRLSVRATLSGLVDWCKKQGIL